MFAPPRCVKQPGGMSNESWFVTVSSIPSKTSGIYKITCLPTGKVYVGSAYDIAKRWSQHRQSLNTHHHCNDYLQAAWEKYGEQSFICEILERVERVDLYVREQHWLDALLPFGDRGFNLCRKSAGRLLSVD